MLSTDLDPRNTRDRTTLDALLNGLVATLDLRPTARTDEDSSTASASSPAGTVSYIVVAECLYCSYMVVSFSSIMNALF